MELGNFSVSLAVKDLQASKDFYTKIGFDVFLDQSENNYMILKNGKTIIGLFQGMFEKNILTFNPGWDENAQQLENFDDIRELQKKIRDNGIELTTEADENSKGPASFTLIDPDGNPILFDQHV
jgi:predicted enzyme related to lactoylglutathione lyase